MLRARWVAAIALFLAASSCQGGPSDTADADVGGAGGSSSDDTDLGGRSSGGRSSGGAEAGGTHAGGSETGGHEAGGTDSGGAPTDGSEAGGSGGETDGDGGTSSDGSGAGGTGGDPSSGGASTGGYAGAENYPDTAFVTVWQTDATTVHGDAITDERTVVLPLVAGGTYDLTVDWGDDTTSKVTSYGDPDRTHEYAVPGTYVVVLRGLLEGWHFDFTCWVEDEGHCLDSTSDAHKLREIRQWGTFHFGSPPSSFENCSALVINAADVPDLSPPVTLARAFKGCESLGVTSAFDEWDVTHVTDLDEMFRDATTFEGDLSGWNTSSVTDMGGMFQDAYAFNADLSGWDTGSVVDFSGMFAGAYAFTGDLSAWDTSSAVNMNFLFYGAGVFNSDLSFWDTSTVTDMSGMFYGATSFNGDISFWDTSHVTNMRSMLRDATAFDRNLGPWDVTALTDATQMLDGSGLSVESYDALLVGWGAQACHDGVPLGAEGLEYSATGAPARTVLTNTRGWMITGDDPAP